MPKLKARKLDAATEQQAIAAAQNLIELRGGLSHNAAEIFHPYPPVQSDNGLGGNSPLSKYSAASRDMFTGSPRSEKGKAATKLRQTAIT